LFALIIDAKLLSHFTIHEQTITITPHVIKDTKS